ncbi:MAG TPA: tetratricopeptide repeat protein [Myxococcales bacterium]
MNGFQAVDWLPGIGVLAVGLVVGIVLAWRSLASARRAQRSAAEPLPLEVRDLEGKRDALLRQLEELDETGTKLSEAQLAQQRYGLEVEAARVLLALDEAGAAVPARSGVAGAAPAAAARAPAPDAAQRPAMRGFLWGMGSTAAVLSLAFFVYVSAKPRDSGGAVTGAPGREPAAQDDSAAADEARVKEVLARDPENLDARVALAELELERRDFMGAWNDSAKVLAKQPDNPRATTCQAMVRLAMGQGTMAVDLLKKAVATDPDLISARAYLAMAYARTGRMSAASSTIAEASRKFPERAADLQRLLADLQNEGPAPAMAASATGTDPHAGLAAPGGAAATTTAAPSSAPASPGGRRVAGVIDLEPSLKAQASPSGILFVYVRSAHASGGPPIAVKRLPAVFPAAFELGQADSMMGQEFPESVQVEARLDADGDPTTRSPTDPKAHLDDVKAGRTDLRLMLKRP